MENEKLHTRIRELEKEAAEKDKLLWTSMWIMMIESLVAMLAGMMAATYLIPEGAWQVLAIFGCLIVFLIPCFYALKIEISVGAYKCRECGREIVPTYGQALRAMHRGTTRRLLCPACGKRTWCKKIIQKEARE